ncbi:unnamed protein product [Colias eurytheme]|nr:unnamed protein product [Colias eurytheme]
MCGNNLRVRNTLQGGYVWSCSAARLSEQCAGRRRHCRSCSELLVRSEDTVKWHLTYRASRSSLQITGYRESVSTKRIFMCKLAKLAAQWSVRASDVGAASGKRRAGANPRL